MTAEPVGAWHVSTALHRDSSGRWHLFPAKAPAMPHHREHLYYLYFKELDEYFGLIANTNQDNPAYHAARKGADEASWQVIRNTDRRENSKLYTKMNFDVTNFMQEYTHPNEYAALLFFSTQMTAYEMVHRSAPEAQDALISKEMLACYTTYRAKEIGMSCALESEAFRLIQNGSSLFHEKEISKTVCLFICSFPGHNPACASSNWTIMLRDSQQWNNTIIHHKLVIDYYNFFEYTLKINKKYNRRGKNHDEEQHHTYFRGLDAYLGDLFDTSNPQVKKCLAMCDDAVDVFTDTFVDSHQVKHLEKVFDTFDDIIEKATSEQSAKRLYAAWRVIFAPEEQLEQRQRLTNLCDRYTAYKDAGNPHSNIVSVAMR